MLQCTLESGTAAAGLADSAACICAEGWTLIDDSGSQLSFNFGPQRRQACRLWRSKSGTIAGLLDMPPEDFERCTDERSYADLLSDSFPQLPMLWIPLISRQLQVCAPESYCPLMY